MHNEQCLVSRWCAARVVVPNSLGMMVGTLGSYDSSNMFVTVSVSTSEGIETRVFFPQKSRFARLLYY